MNKLDMAELQDQARRRWRQWRRQHAQRPLGERRLLVLAGVAVCWYVLDLTLFTPSLDQFGATRKRLASAEQALQARQADAARLGSDLAAMEGQLKSEVARMRVSVAQQQKALADVQAGLVPAREMRQVMQGLLARNGQLSLVAMRTLTQDEIGKAGLAIQDTPGLYRQGLEVVMQGAFNDLLDWLVSAEQMPRKLWWSGLQMSTDEQGRLRMTVRLFTLSPDPDPLEIAEP